MARRTPSSAGGQKIKVTGSAFGHLSKGIKLLLNYNPASLLGLSFISVVASVALNFVLVFSLLYLVLNTDGSNAIMIVRLVFFAVILLITVTLVSSYFQLALNRGIVASIKMRTISVSDALLFAKARFKLALLTNFVIFAKLFGIMLAFIIGATIFGGLDNSFGTLISILLILAMIVVMIRFVLRIIFVQFVLADDHIPPHTNGIMQHATRLWHISSGAVARYIIMTIILSIAFLIVYSIIFGADSLNENQSGSLASDTTTELDLFSMIVSNTIGTFVSVLFAGGYAHIYGQANILLREQGPRIVPPAPHDNHSHDAPHENIHKPTTPATPSRSTHTQPPEPHPAEPDLPKPIEKTAELPNSKQS